MLLRAVPHRTRALRRVVGFGNNNAAAFDFDADFGRKDKAQVSQLAFNGNGLTFNFRRNALRQSYGIFANA